MADYPFTTLHPNLGVVYAGPLRSFVMADIPGLIAGAAEGSGLGTRFLRHLERTRLLLHVVDIAPAPGSPATPAADAIEIVRELERFSPELARKERWLVLNKIDLVPGEEARAREAEIVAALGWTGPVHRVSALRAEVTARLVGDVRIAHRLRGGKRRLWHEQRVQDGEHQAGERQGDQAAAPAERQRRRAGNRRRRHLAEVAGEVERPDGGAPTAMLVKARDQRGRRRVLAVAAEAGQRRHDQQQPEARHQRHAGHADGDPAGSERQRESRA